MIGDFAFAKCSSLAPSMVAEISWMMAERADMITSQARSRITICKQSVMSEKPSESHIIAEKGMVALM